MAGIKQALESVIAQVKTIPVINGDGSSVVPHTRVWNNQVQQNDEGKMASFPMPAFFVEMSTPNIFRALAQGARESDISFKIHIVHEYYNGADGTMEQDLAVFDLRDKVIAYLTQFQPVACGALDCISETQDYEHNNVYHYICEFVCNFTDSKGSRYDSEHPNAYASSPVPLAVEGGLTIIGGGTGGILIETKFNL